MASARAGEPPAKVPVIYSTDLYHPHVDADDHWDIATLLAIEEIDLLGVVLDNAGSPSQEDAPGEIPLRQIRAISGRQFPSAMGLRGKLKGPDDKGLDQAPKYQGGAELILEVLRKSPVRVNIVAVGSMRDVAAALNREPDLFREKAGRVLAFIGDAAEARSKDEYNVRLDPAAWARLLRSDLDLRWVPCFDGGAPRNDGHASFWMAPRKACFETCAPEVQQFFLYCLKKKAEPPIAALREPVDPAERDWLLKGSKELWCTAIFTTLSGRLQVHDGKRWLVLPPERAAGLAERKVFGFSTVEVTASDDGSVRYGPGPGSRKVERFEVLDRERYAEAMTSMTAGLLEGLGR